MTACHCGSRDFIVEEVLQHAADTRESGGLLIVHDRDIANDLSRVFCKQCRAELSFADFDCSELFSCD